MALCGEIDLNSFSFQRGRYMWTWMKTALISAWLVNLILVDAAKGDWKQDWEKTVAAAEKEG